MSLRFASELMLNGVRPARGLETSEPGLVREAMINRRPVSRHVPQPNTTVTPVPRHGRPNITDLIFDDGFTNGDRMDLSGVDGRGGRRPGDERGFIHKKIIGIGKQLIGNVPFVGGIAETLLETIIPGGRGRPRAIPETLPTTRSPWEEVPGHPESLPIIASGGFDGRNGARDCRSGLRWDPRLGACVSPISPVGADSFGGEAIMGRHGPGEVPGSRITDVATCGRGMVLGNDGICYKGLANKYRMYPRGRRPLLTGGDLNAITRSRSAGRKLATAREDLVGLGMLKIPTKRKKRSAPTLK